MLQSASWRAAAGFLFGIRYLVAITHSLVGSNFLSIEVAENRSPGEDIPCSAWPLHFQHSHVSITGAVAQRRGICHQGGGDTPAKTRLPPASSLGTWKVPKVDGPILIANHSSGAGSSSTMDGALARNSLLPLPCRICLNSRRQRQLHFSHMYLPDCWPFGWPYSGFASTHVCRSTRTSNWPRIFTLP